VPAETERDQRDVAVTAVVSDPIDGAARLLADIAKFGLCVRELHVVSEPRGKASVRMTLAAPAGMDTRQICSRLSRHVSVVALDLA
jgi:hypothetical protein